MFPNVRWKTLSNVATVNPEMWFVSIATLKDTSDFSTWISGKRVECKDSMEFEEWLAAYNAFPLQFYLDGVTYSLRNREEAYIFQCGWEAAMRLRIENGQLSE